VPSPTTTIGYALDAEWLEADGLGGFASGTVGGARTRRYHALLLAATTPPTGRVVLVNGIEAWVETAGGGRFALSTQRYAPDVLHPDGQNRVARFEPEPWPSWLFRCEDGTEVVQEVAAVRDSPTVVLRWRLAGGVGARLFVRPLMSGRDYHGLHHENPAFGFEPRRAGEGALAWRPYPDLPAVTALSNGAYAHEPSWYRNFLYEKESERGLDDREDLASPGTFSFDLGAGHAVLVLRAGEPGESAPPAAEEARRLLEGEAARRRAFASPLHRAADAYVVRRGSGRTVLAGYPWFTDWGRDTFISLRGLLTVPGGLELGREILLAWAPAESRGMLPNRFPDRGEEPEYNSVDAALWFVVACHEFLAAAKRRQPALVGEAEERTLVDAIGRVLNGYHQGSRHGVRADTDGLLAAGEPGVQLTWMDVKIGDWVVTPRIGKPVEVQALWLNALAIGARHGVGDCAHLYRRGRATFQDRFWDEGRGCLHDVVDADHVRGRVDPSFRPNQILAVGGLPFRLLDEPQAGRVVEAVERRLLTPLGLRSLAPGEPGYRGRYEGGVMERDSAYHQGTVWPWPMGPFVEAWLRVRGGTAEARREAKERFLAPLREHLGVVEGC
jgi:predicted glycogen debranching enzyme